MWRAVFLLSRAWLVDRWRYWLVCWVGLADLLVSILSFGQWDLCTQTEKAHDWLQARQYRDSEEGPWDTYEGALRFAKAEVGVPYRVLYIQGGWRVYVRNGGRM